MESLAGYLDEIKKRKELETDTQLAALLKVSRQHVSRIRAGDYMGEEKCFEIADLLGIEPLEIISLNWAIRAKNKKISKYWMKIHEEFL